MKSISFITLFSIIFSTNLALASVYDEVRASLTQAGLYGGWTNGWDPADGEEMVEVVEGFGVEKALPLVKLLAKYSNKYEGYHNHPIPAQFRQILDTLHVMGCNADRLLGLASRHLKEEGDVVMKLGIFILLKKFGEDGLPMIEDFASKRNSKYEWLLGGPNNKWAGVGIDKIYTTNIRSSLRAAGLYGNWMSVVWTPADGEEMVAVVKSFGVEKALPLVKLLAKYSNRYESLGGRPFPKQFKLILDDLYAMGCDAERLLGLARQHLRKTGNSIVKQGIIKVLLKHKEEGLPMIDELMLKRAPPYEWLGLIEKLNAPSAPARAQVETAAPDGLFPCKGTNLAFMGSMGVVLMIALRLAN